MQNTFRFRVNILFLLIVIGAALLITRLYFVQVVSGEEYLARADRQYVRPNQNLFDRGSIFFQTKSGDKVPAATIKRGFTLAINPTLISDSNDVYEKLKNVVEIDREDFFNKAGKTDDPYEEVAKRLEEETAEKIENLGIEGVQVFREQWRYYPGNKMGSHMLGFVGYKDDILAGRYGLEREYEEILSRGKSSLYVNFFAEIFADVKSRVFNSDDEGDVVTTIEPSVQAFLERQIESINQVWDSEYTGGIIMNPKTGAIFALAADPSYDPNVFNEVDNPSLFTNPLVEDVYERGSVVKPLTVAAGLDSGVITPNTTYEDKGYLVLNNSRISNYDGQARGVVPIQEILNQSLNTGVAFIADKMGSKSFKEYMEGFGLSEKTNIDLPNEAQNLTDNLNSPRDIEIATASYGQGIALTPVSITRALASLGNGGYLVEPHVVERVEFELGDYRSVSPDLGDRKQVISKETSEEITRMLVRVVDEALKNGEVALPRHSIAAKTGTAQIAKEDEGGYYDDRFLHSFFGYFPAYDPEFIVFLYTVHPKNGSRYSSETLTDPFIDIAEFLINYYNIKPDR